jgi:hypothetical protein
MKCAGHVVGVGEMRNSSFLKPEGKKDHSEDQGILTKLFRDVDWIYLAQDEDLWRALVNKVTFHKMRGIVWPDEVLLASQGLCSAELLSQSVSMLVTSHCPLLF